MHNRIDFLVVSARPVGEQDGVGDYSYILATELERVGFRVQIVATDKPPSTMSGQKTVYTTEQVTWSLIGLLRCARVLHHRSPKCILFQYVPYAYHKKGIPFQLLFYFILFRVYTKHLHINFHEIAVRPKGTLLAGKLRSLMQRLIAWSLCLLSNSRQTSIERYQQLLGPFNVRVLPIPSNFEFTGTLEKAVFFRNNRQLRIVANFNRFTEYAQAVLSCIGIEWELMLIGRATTTEIAAFCSSPFYVIYKNSITMNLHACEEVYVSCIKQATIYLQIECVTSEGYGGISAKSGSCATAFMLGTPVFTTKGDLTDESLFVDKENIFFLDPKCAHVAAASIENTLQNQDMLRRVSTSSINLYNGMFSWRGTLRNAIQLIHE